MKKKCACLTSWLSKTTPSCRLPKIPVFGTAKAADLGAAESGTCEGEFREVFGTALENPAGRADTDAQFQGDDLPRGTGGSEVRSRPGPPINPHKIKSMHPMRRRLLFFNTLG